MVLPQSNRLLLASVCLSILWTASVTFASNTKLPVSACSKIFGGGSIATVASLKIKADIDAYIEANLKDMTKKDVAAVYALDDLTHVPSFLRKLRLPFEVRIRNAQALVPGVEKFKHVTDKQLQEQWLGSDTLNLPGDPSLFNYFAPLSGHTRGEFIKVVRTVYLSEINLRELLATGLFTSRVIHAMNYDREAVRNLYELIGLNNLKKMVTSQVGGGATAISTTYAIDGYGNTRPEKPLIFDPNLQKFALQVEFLIPVEAIVLVPMESLRSSTPTRLPEHVERDPMGYGIVITNKKAHQEAEITFLEAIPPQWLSTNFNWVQQILDTRTYPVQNRLPNGHFYE